MGNPAWGTVPLLSRPGVFLAFWQVVYGFDRFELVRKGRRFVTVLREGTLRKGTEERATGWADGTTFRMKAPDRRRRSATFQPREDRHVPPLREAGCHVSGLETSRCRLLA